MGGGAGVVIRHKKFPRVFLDAVVIKTDVIAFQVISVIFFRPFYKKTVFSLLVDGKVGDSETDASGVQLIKERI